MSSPPEDRAVPHPPEPDRDTTERTLVALSLVLSAIVIALILAGSV